MRAPSHAPATRYPYGRSPTLGGFLGLVAACGLASILAWLFAGTRSTELVFKAAIGLGAWIFSSLVAWQGWRGMPVGELSWDGGQWILDGATPGDQQIALAWPRVHIDLQSGVLLSLRPMHGRTVWLWLERRSDPQRWLMLRRALYSPAQALSADMAATMGPAPPRREDGAHT